VCMYVDPKVHVYII